MSDKSKTILAEKNLSKHLGKGRGRVHVLRGLDLDVRRGEFLAIMGPSGCGKSTLLHVLGLITPPDGGTLTLDGRPAPAGSRDRTAYRRKHIGFVFQRFNLLPVLSAEGNVKLSLKVRGREY